MMKVGLLGGSFNPPHQGHLYISELAIKKLQLNQVWWIPTFANPLKEISIPNLVENSELLPSGQSRFGMGLPTNMGRRSCGVKNLKYNHSGFFSSNGYIYESHQARLQRCKNLLQNHSKVRVKNFDDIYSEPLIRKLQAKYKNVEFTWLMGADNLENFHEWKNFKKLLNAVPLAIFAREKFLVKIRKAKSWKFVAASNPSIFFTKNLPISSSKIRGVKTLSCHAPLNTN